jgi:hypothetical protein
VTCAQRRPRWQVGNVSLPEPYIPYIAERDLISTRRQSAPETRAFSPEITRSDSLGYPLILALYFADNLILNQEYTFQFYIVGR